jgi:hypothetical protein
MHKHASLFLALAAIPLAAAGCGGSTSQRSNSPQTNDGGEEGSVTPPDGGGHMDSGGGMDAGHDSGPMQECMPMNGMIAPGFPAMHAPLPQVGYQGGGVLQTPEVVTVTFPGDSMAPQVEAFGDGILQTCWWDTVRAGYCEANGMSCVGRGVVPAKPHVELTAAAATSYTDSAMGGASTLQQFIQQQVSSGTFPAPDAGTIYAVYFPSGTSISLDGAQSCVNGGFGGYHNSMTVTPPGGSNTVVSYAVIPRCTNTVAEITFAASHELSEASTDPHVGENQIGYYLSQSNLDYLPWALLGGGEIGDLCVDPTGANQDQTTATLGSTTWTVQRIWSNANAAASLDPCVPMPSSEVYFNLAPEAGNGTLNMTVGATQTFTATAFSTAPMADWTIEGADLAQLQGQTPIVQVTLSANTAKNGDSITVTVKLNSTPPPYPGTNIPAEPYFLVSAVSQQGPIHLWPMLVTSQ